MRRDHFLLAAAVLSLLCSHANARRTLLPQKAVDSDSFCRLCVPPVTGQAGLILSTAEGPLTGTGAFCSFGLGFGKREKGRTDYSRLSSTVLLGGEWSPESAAWLGIGGEAAVLQTNTFFTRLPPVIDEKETYADIGNLRIKVKARLLERSWRLHKRDLELTVTPFFKLGMPTDTSRLRPNRRMPVRRVVNQTVFYNPYFTVETGISASLNLFFAGLHTHQALLAVPVPGGTGRIYYSMHTWLAASIASHVEIIAQVDALLSSGKGSGNSKYNGFGFSPGVRINISSISLEMAVRMKMNDDGYWQYGDFQGLFSLLWHKE